MASDSDASATSRVCNDRVGDSITTSYVLSLPCSPRGGYAEDNDRERGFRTRNAWDNYYGTGETEEGLTCRGYIILAMLLMRAGAAMPPGLRDAFLNESKDRRDALINSAADAGSHFVAQQVCAEIRRYDVRGGRTFRLPFELPSDIVAGNGSRYRFMSNTHESPSRDLLNTPKQ